ncbi:MAG: hypothetical protein JSW28_10605 [Thermoplasmata archaeon]|nr:MAG: hypothetical protein JSW28_10605 [Thermoplasmata archaeon]
MVSLIRKGLDRTKDMAQKSVDAAKKKMDVLEERKGPKEPESRLEGDMKFYLCTVCRNRFGPVEATMSDKLYAAKTMKGITSYMIKTDEGLPVNLRNCPSCGIWVCGNCWNIEQHTCRKCTPYMEVLDIPEGYPNLRTDYSNFRMEFYYACDRCGREYGPGGSKEEHVRVLTNCPGCSQWTCSYCLNSERGKCFTCAPSFQPEVRFEKSMATKFIESAIFMCSQCRQEVGSVTKKKWRAGDEKKYLVQCETCGRWVCGDCWNEEERRCVYCNPYTPPAIRTEKEGLNEYVYFICATCRKEHGPITEKDWKEMAKTGFRAVGVVGSVTGNPALIATGFIGTTVAGKGDSSTSMATIKRKSIKELDFSMKFLARCPQCKRWVCLTCWDKLRGECNNCQRKSEIEEESKYVPPTYVAAGDLYEGGKIEIKDSVVSKTDFGDGAASVQIEDSIVQKSSIGEDVAGEAVLELRCSKCQCELQVTWKACPKCGEPVAQKCPGCGETVELDWMVCPYCERDL